MRHPRGSAGVKDPPYEHEDIHHWIGSRGSPASRLRPQSGRGDGGGGSDSEPARVSDGMVAALSRGGLCDGDRHAFSVDLAPKHLPPPSRFSASTAERFFGVPLTFGEKVAAFDLV